MLQDLEKIKLMRQKVGLTQTQLAKLAGVSQSLITKIERGTLEPSYSIVKRIFYVLDEKLSDTQKIIIAKTICTKKITFIKSSDSISYAIKIMKRLAISQIPVIKENIIVGSITEETFIKNFNKIKNKDMKVEEIMDEPFPTISEETNLALIRNILKTYSAIILTKSGRPTGIITKADLLKKL